jgi:hypothetical protein
VGRAWDDPREVVIISLLDADNDTWLNQVHAARVKGSPLSRIERQRILDGKRWNGAKDYRDTAPRPEDQDE